MVQCLFSSELLQEKALMKNYTWGDRIIIFPPKINIPRDKSEGFFCFIVLYNYYQPAGGLRGLPDGMRCELGFNNDDVFSVVVCNVRRRYAHFLDYQLVYMRKINF